MYTKQNGSLVEWDRSNGYYLAGFQDKTDKGVLTALTYVPGVGTCLVPVFDSEGQNIVNEEMAGKDYK